MPRRKITEPSTIDASALPEITAQQQEFVRGVLAGKTATDAYRAAYNTENMLPRTIWAEASRLNCDPSVSTWLSAARQACLGSAVLTREQHMAQLERIREAAMASGNIGAAVAAEQTRGKVAGHHIERIQEVPADVTDTLKTIAQHQPDLAATLAAAHGIPWGADEHATKH
jgi:hypothetical protein